jgi:protease PrsW
MLWTAFVWGAIPAVVVALGLELFLRLPPNIGSPHTLENLQLGLLAPALEEVLKGAGLLYIFWRFRGKFNTVLDGMIYGAIVGFGFAMTTNLLRYTANFLAWGYPGLSSDLIIERTLHALDHGLYTAIFGAGLGFAFLVHSRWRWALATGGLGLAIFIHITHNLLAHSLVGFNLFTGMITAGGTLVLWAVAGWSLFQQKRCIQTELKDILPESLYHNVVNPLVSARAQWYILRKKGLRTWRQTWRLHNLCARLAFTRRHARQFPDEADTASQAEALWEEISHNFSDLIT